MIPKWDWRNENVLEGEDTDIEAGLQVTSVENDTFKNDSVWTNTRPARQRSIAIFGFAFVGRYIRDLSVQNGNLVVPVSGSLPQTGDKKDIIVAER